MATYIVKTGSLDSGVLDSPAAARPDLKDNWDAVGKISDEGGNNVVVKTDASGNAILTGGLTTAGDTLIQTSSATALVVGDGTTDVLAVDTDEDFVKISDIITNCYKPLVNKRASEYTYSQLDFTISNIFSQVEIELYVLQYSAAPNRYLKYIGGRTDGGAYMIKVNELSGSEHTAVSVSGNNVTIKMNSGSTSLLENIYAKISGKNITNITFATVL